ncbi:unnamed protein product, partial [marine sediment metagenome]
FSNDEFIPVTDCDSMKGGAHRVACALYFGVKDVRVKRLRGYGEWYGVSWFLENGFSLGELDLIQKKQEEIFECWGIDLKQ